MQRKNENLSWLFALAVSAMCFLALHRPQGSSVYASALHASALHASAPRPDLLLLTGSRGATTILVFSPDGHTLASGGNTVLLYERRSGEIKRWLPVSTYVQALAFSPDGRRLAVNAWNNQTWAVQLWDTTTGKLLSTFPAKRWEVRTLAFARDGKTLLGVDQGGAALAWQLPSGRIRQLVPPTDFGFSHVAIAPDTQLFAHESAIPEENGSYDIAHVREMRTGRLVTSLDQKRLNPTALTFSPDSRLLATGSSSGIVQVWDVKTGRVLRKMVDLQPPQGSASDITVLAFSRDGKTLAAGGADMGIKVWNAQSGKWLYMLADPSYWSDYPLATLAFSPDSRILASGHGDGTQRWWQVASGKLLRTVIGHAYPVESMVIAPDGHLLASASGEDLAVRVWDARSGLLKRTLTEHTDTDYGVLHLAFSPDGRYLASGRKNGTVILWSARTLQLLRVIRAHDNWIPTIAFSPDSTLLAVPGDGEVTLWNVATGARQRTVKTRDSRNEWVAFTSDGKRLLIKDSGKQVSLWVVATGKRLRTVAQGSQKVLLSPDGQTLAVGPDFRGERTKLLDLATGQVRRVLEGKFYPHEGPAAFSRDSKTLATVGNWGATGGQWVQLWNVDTGKLKQAVGDTEDTISVAFSPDGQRIACGFDDGLLSWRDLARRQVLVSSQVLPPAIEGAVSREWITFTPQSYYAGQVGSGRFLRWQVSGRFLPFHTHARALRRPDLVQKALRSAPLRSAPLRSHKDQ